MYVTLVRHIINAHFRRVGERSSTHFLLPKDDRMYCKKAAQVEFVEGRVVEKKNKERRNTVEEKD